MQNLTVKVCGITREADARDALEAGVNWVGVNLYSPSPRSLTLARATELLQLIPAGMRVCVDVAPEADKLRDCVAIGFDRFQIHFDPLMGADASNGNEASKATSGRVSRQPDTPITLSPLAQARVSEWRSIVGGDHLWLAPRLPDPLLFPGSLPGIAERFLIDGYSKSRFGGTGKTARWDAFAALRQKYPELEFILAGGLSPHNIAQAVTESATRFIDINSGIEDAPGEKSREKLLAVFQALEQAGF